MPARLCRRAFRFSHASTDSRTPWHPPAPFLLIAQRRRRIDARCARRRQIARAERREDHGHRRHQEHPGIEDRHVHVRVAANDLRAAMPPHSPGPDLRRPGDSRHESPSALICWRRRAERHAHAELARAIGDDVRLHAEQADHRQQQREGARDRACPCPPSGHISNGPDNTARPRPITSTPMSASARRIASRRRGHAHHRRRSHRAVTRNRSIEVLLQRQKHERPRRAVQRSHVGIARDADHGRLAARRADPSASSRPAPTASAGPNNCRAANSLRMITGGDAGSIVRSLKPLPANHLDAERAEQRRRRRDGGDRMRDRRQTGTSSPGRQRSPRPAIAGCTPNGRPVDAAMPTRCARCCALSR